MSIGANLLYPLLDERRAPEEEAGDVREDVVDHDHEARHEQPDEAAQQVRRREVRRRGDHQNRHVRPRELHVPFTIQMLRYSTHAPHFRIRVESSGTAKFCNCHSSDGLHFASHTSDKLRIAATRPVFSNSLGLQVLLT